LFVDVSSLPGYVLAFSWLTAYALICCFILLTLRFKAFSFSFYSSASISPGEELNNIIERLKSSDSFKLNSSLFFMWDFD